MKIQLSHRMYSVFDLKRLHDAKELNIQPKYQRRRTPWPANAKTGLIDTIVSNYPIPPVYINNYVDKAQRRRSEVIDGQQRLTTIFEFLDNKFALTGTFSDPDLVGSFFKDLPLEIQNQIRDYELSCMAIRGAQEPDIIAIFSRMNSYSLPLNDQEKRNAVFAGEFKTLVYDLASEYYTFWTAFGILSDAVIARMRDAELVSEMLAVVMRGLDSISKQRLTKIYEDYDDRFPKKTEYRNFFTRMAGDIGKIFEDERVSSQFRKSAWFFPLFLYLYETYYGALGSEKLVPARQPDLARIRPKLRDFVNKYIKGSLPKDTRLLFQQGSKTVSKVHQRYEILKNHLED